MRFQTRAAAAWGPWQLFTCVTPGRLFQMATSRSAGQPAISPASSFWLRKLSKGVVLAAAASCWLATAVMLFCSSMVKIVIMVLLGATLLRGHHISHSDLLETQGNCPVNRRRRRGGDEELGQAQMGADGRRWHGTKFGRKKSRPLHPLLSQFSESVVRLFGPLDTSAQQEPSCGTLANQANLDWTKLGRALRASADDAHDGKTPDRHNRLLVFA